MKFCLLYQIIYIKKILQCWIIGVRNNLQELVIKIPRLKLKCFAHFLKNSTVIQSNQLYDLAIYDKPGSFRFFVLYIFLSVNLNMRINLCLNVNEFTSLWSIGMLFSSSVWSEREAFDMYGIIFLENIDLRRILTDYGFKGYPLRKDFPLTGFIEVFFNEINNHIVYKKVSFAQAYRIMVT